MNTPVKNAPSTLILKMVGGNLNGKLLPISTQKCFLTGGDSADAGQCAIVRGPNGTALRAQGTEVCVNGVSDTLHWLKEGDHITIGEMQMVVMQLGHFPETADSQTKLNNPAQKVAPVTNQTQPQSANVPDASTTQPETKPEPPANKIATDVAANNASAPTSETPQEAKQRENEERLEQALKSLDETNVENKTKSAESTGSTESLIDQRLDKLESDLDSHETSYSEPLPSATPQPTQSPAEPKATTTEEVTTEPEAAESNVVAQPEAATQTENTKEVDVKEPLAKFESTAEEALNALPTLKSPSVEATESTAGNLGSEDTVGSEDTGVTDEEQAKLDAIMARLGIGDGEKEESTPKSEPDEKAEVETPPVRQRFSTVPTETASPASTRVPAPTIQQVPSSPPLADSENQVDATSTDADAASEAPEVIKESTLETPIFKNSVVEESEATISTDGQDTLEETPEEEQPVSEAPVEEVAQEEASQKEASQKEASQEASNESGEQQSVADILARMKSQGKLDQFEAPTDDNNGLASESSLPEPTPTVETPAEPTPAPQMETEQDAAAQADGGDESVQDYMNQLFQRLRGEDAPEAAGAASPEPAPKTSEPTPKVEKKEVKETKEVQESQTQLPETPPAKVLEAAEYIPKQKAPEALTDMQRMRQLANKQKSNNVSKSFRAKSKLDQAISTYVAGGAFAGVLAFGWIAKSLYDPAGILAGICLVVGLFALQRYMANLKKLKEAGKVAQPNENN